MNAFKPWGVVVLSVVLVAALGVLAGRAITSWKTSRAHQEQEVRLERGELSRLRAGEAFPRVELAGPDRGSTTTTAILEGRNAIVLFLDPTCDGCFEAVSVWNSYLEEGEESPFVVGIAGGGWEVVDAYAREEGLRFPVYADPPKTFATVHEVHAIPTIVGVRSDGAIAFVRHGLSEDFTPARAESLLARP